MSENAGTEFADRDLATKPSFATERTRLQPFAGVFAVGVCVLVAVLCGYWIGNSRQAANAPLPLLHASTAATSSTMAVATGQVGIDAEGIFFLDFITGDLQCLVYYPRIGVFGARFYTNVLKQLPGGGRNSQFLMVTGTAIPTGISVGPRPGNCLVYITDATSGMFAAYAIPWDRTAEAGGRLQSGPLVFVGGGPIRNFQLSEAATQQAAAANQPAAVTPPGVVDPNKKK